MSPSSTGFDLGASALPFQNLFLSGGSSSPTSNFFEITGTPTGLDIITLPDGTTTLVGTNAAQALSNKTFSDILRGFRYSVAQATTLVSGDFVLTGWGTGASLSVTNTQSKDQAFTVTITAGTSPAANPTIKLNFSDGTWTHIPVCTLSQTGGNDLFATTFPVALHSPVAYTWQWNATSLTPTLGKTYEFTGICMGT